MDHVMLAAGVGESFFQVAGVLAVCALVGGVALLLRQPLILGLLLAGILVGPEVLGLVEGSTEIELLAELGIAVLLFVVGLKLDVRVVRNLGPVALSAGSAQIAFTAAVGFALALAFGYDAVGAGYVAIALSFSSTIIVVKLLSDRREIDTVHGRIAIGILIVQDIVVVLAMIGLSGFEADGASIPSQLGGIVVRGTLLLAGVAILARTVLPRAVHLLARQGELLVLAAVGWAILLASVTTLLGFTEEVGAFIAGVALASSPYRDAISGRLTTLRDFLLVFFFIDLGVSFDLGAALEAWVPALALSLFVLLGKPFIVIVFTGALGYRSRTSFQSGLTLGQISEFSLILVALGAGLGHVGPDVVGLVTGVALLTIGASTLLVGISDRLFAGLSSLLRPFERQRSPRPMDLDSSLRPHAVVIGLGRFGDIVVDQLEGRGYEVLGVDFDPRSVEPGRAETTTIFGDAEDPELPHHLPLAGVSWVVCTIRHRDAGLGVLRSFRHHGYSGRIAVSSDDPAVEQELYEAGADLVVHPFREAAGPLVNRMLDAS